MTSPSNNISTLFMPSIPQQLIPMPCHPKEPATRNPQLAIHNPDPDPEPAHPISSHSIQRNRQVQTMCSGRQPTALPLPSLPLPSPRLPSHPRPFQEIVKQYQAHNGPGFLHGNVQELLTEGKEVHCMHRLFVVCIDIHIRGRRWNPRLGVVKYAFLDSGIR